MSALKAGPSGSPAHHPEGARALPDGTSLRPSSTEVSHQRLKSLELELQQVHERLKHQEEEFKSKQSSWRIQETQLLQENRELRNRLESTTAALQEVKNQSELRPLEGTPQLIIEQSSSKESLSLKLLQKVYPLLKSYKMQIVKLTEKLKRSQQKPYSKDMRRVPHSSADAAGTSNQAGPSTMALTLSLASQQPEKHSAINADRLATKAPLGDSSIAARFDRHGPVENSSHEYGNVWELRREQGPPQTLVTENIPSRMMDSGLSGSLTKRLKPPVPMPRSRSLKTGTMRPRTNSPESFEIVDKPQAQAPSNIPSRALAKIHEQPHHLSFNNSQATNSDQPMRLSHRVIAAPAMPVGVHQECDVCNTRFPHFTQEQFLTHCIECADRATEEELEQSYSLAAAADPNLRVCPLCQEKFGPAVSQTDYENHVQSHFREDDTREAAWESVTAD